jgi:hypothetical protein
MRSDEFGINDIVYKNDSLPVGEKKWIAFARNQTLFGNIANLRFPDWRLGFH